MTNNKVDGVKVCEEAFERLKAGKPNHSAHVGLPRNKITAGIVSVEAGFDRGYLKKSRKPHIALVSTIEAYRSDVDAPSASSVMQVKRAQNKADKALSELEQARAQLYAVLTQNMQLVERVKDLEAELKKSRKVASIKRGLTQDR